MQTRDEDQERNTDAEAGPGLERLARSIADGSLGVEEVTLYRSLLDNIPALVYVDPADENLESFYVSPHVVDLLGVTQEEWLSDPYSWVRRVHPDDVDRTWDEYEQWIGSGRPLHREYRMFHRNGDVRWVVERAVQIRRPDGGPWLILGTIVDVTNQRDGREAAFLAYHDNLTGLPNRALFEEMLSLELGRARRADTSVALLFVDLDLFKQVNDTMGHLAGDLLLAGIAGRLRPCLREADVFARRSGDEFLILLNDLPAGESTQAGSGAATSQVIHRIAEALLEPFDLHGTAYTASASIGIAFFPEDADDVPTLMKHADEAMYRSKRTGPGGHRFWHEGTVDDGLPWKGAPAAATLSETPVAGSWTMRYQPVVNLDDGVVRGVEAFPRSTSSGGVDGRSPLGEQIHTIESVGRWTLDELCRQDRAWRAEGLELDLQFKLASRQLWSSFLTDSILAPLREAGIRPHRVTVEVSDAVLIAEPERTGKVMHELMAWGLNVALDDFGTGHPSLSRLDHVPVQMLKIDRSLIRGIDDDVEQTGIVRAIVETAERLGMTTQALGVETSAETEILRSLGVGAAQGFWFGRPVPGDQIAGAVRRTRTRPSPD